MNISLIGTGNAATVLAKLIVSKGHHLQEIVARDLKAAEELTTQTGGRPRLIADFIPENCDLIIVALSDNSLPDAIAGIDFKEIPVVHTAGAVSIGVLKNLAVNYGVLYPLQSLRKDMQAIPPIPFLIEANNEKTGRLIQDFAFTLSDNVRSVGREDRLRLHAAAVVVNNFTNYLYMLAEEFCKKEKVDFDLLKPLIRETAVRIEERSPASLQTGPAVRNDIDTIDKHLALLIQYPELKKVYHVLTEGLIKGIPT